jgi:S1-C subfamily serine protease
MVLGFHPATHRAMVAAITPIALPGLTAKQLTARSISRIRDSFYRVFQLDGTAYPGNSGSPLYDPDNGTVYGIINAVFVQGTREAAISRPSGITYAIPGQYIRDLLREAKIAEQ